MRSYSTSRQTWILANSLKSELCKPCWGNNPKRRNDESRTRYYFPLTNNRYCFVLVFCNPNTRANALAFTAGSRQDAYQKRAGQPVRSGTSGAATGGNDRLRYQRSTRPLDARFLQRWSKSRRRFNSAPTIPTIRKCRRYWANSATLQKQRSCQSQYSWFLLSSLSPTQIPHSRAIICSRGIFMV